MRISINLATRPFVELRPLFARLRLTMAALVLTAVGLGIGLHVMKARAQVAEAQMRELKIETSVVENERQANATRMMQPANRAVLERSHFLNALFASKSFSWTSVMMDLENVLPAGVQVTSLEPVVTAEGDVNIRLRVSGPRTLQVNLVRNLERSQRFLSPHVANETAQTEEQGRLMQTSGAGVPGGVEFDIVSGYNPLPPAAEKLAEKERTQKDSTEKDGGKPSVSAAKAAHAHKAGAAEARPGSKRTAPGKKPSVEGGAR